MKNLFGTLILTTLLALFCFSYAAAQTIITEEQKLVASDGVNFDEFGSTVFIDGDRAILGAKGDDVNLGAAYIFERDFNGIWHETKLTASDGVRGDEFGVDVSISGDKAIVGAYRHDDNGRWSGAAYIYEHDGNGNWNETRIVHSDSAAFDNFGEQVSIDGDYAIVGAAGNDTNGFDSGSAYIFERDANGHWNEIKLETNDGEEVLFGQSVFIEKNRAMVADRNAVYVFELDTHGGWTEVGQLMQPQGDNSSFALEIFFEDGRAIVSGGNSVYIFERNDNGSWTEITKLTEVQTTFRPVSLSGDFALIGFSDSRQNGDNLGSVKLFKRDIDGDWGENALLIPSDNQGRFGTSVSISGARIIAGTFSSRGPGEAYIFELDDVRPIFTDPYSGSELLDPNGTQTFTWSPIIEGVTEWWVKFGSEEDGNDYFDSGVLPAETLSVTVNDLPIDGSIIHAALWYRLSGDDEWYTSQGKFTAYTPRISFTDPLPGSTLDQSTQVFTWSDNDTDVTSYWLNAGSSKGASNYFNSGNMGLVNSVSVTGLPTDGSTVFIRLWYQDSFGSWRFVDETFLTGGINTSVPVLTYQLVDGRLTNPNGTETFTWSDNGANVTDYWLNVGSTFGASDYHRSGNIGQNTSATVTGLPTDRRSLVYVRLWYRISGGTWDFIDEEYKVFDPTLRPEITSPSDSKLTNESGTETFSWSANGIDITHYWMNVGSQLGYSDYYQSGALNLNTSTTVSGLPTDGTSPIFVRLWYRLRDTGRWDAIDIEYTAAD